MKKKVILSSMLTIALCLSLIAGSTFALFTSESELNIEVNAGKVELIASVENIETWSLEDDKTAAGRTDGKFTQGGSATFANSILTLDKIIPGDKVAFNITGENNSNVTLQYRVKIACTEGKDLMSGLKVTIGTETVTGLVSYVSPWETLAVGADMTAVKVAIELPEEAGNKYQGLSAKISVLVEAIQGNAETFNDAKAGTVVSTVVDPSTGKLVTANDTVISSNGFSADIPAGTTLNAGATTATLTVIKEDASTGGCNFEAAGAETIGLNISIPEVAPDNDAPITITIEDILGTDLTGVMLYHKDVPMTPVDSAAAVDADGEFFYDAATGNITLATTNFSNFTAVVLNSVEVADEAALIKEIAAGKNVTLTSDITLTKTLAIKENVTIDLNGHAINANLSSGALFQSYSGPKPSVLITSFKDGAKINAGDHSVILGYGSTEIYNVEINVGEVTSSSNTPFNVYGNLTLGEGTVVNVEYLGTSLINNSGAIAIVIDGAEINVDEFKVNGGAMISINAATTVELNNAKVNVGLNTTYTSYFINKAENVTVNGCAFKVTDLDGISYVVTETYGWAVDSVEVADEDALIKAIAAGKNVTLTSDITLTKTLLIKKNVIIDLNGCTVSAELPSYAYYLFQSSSDTDPSVLITSSKSGAKINAGDKTVILGYGSTEIYNVEINVGEVTSSSNTPFNVYGNLTLGEGTVVNVEYLGTSLINNSGAIAIVIDGAEINVDEFKVNGGAMISINAATTVELNDAKVNVGLNTTYTSYFINKAENVTVNGCTFKVTDLDGNNYVVTETYGWAEA